MPKPEPGTCKDHQQKSRWEVTEKREEKKSESSEARAGHTSTATKRDSHYLSSERRRERVKTPKSNPAQTDELPSARPLRHDPALGSPHVMSLKNYARTGRCVAWVQCCNESCLKWRRLREEKDPLLLPDDWSCEKNTDLSHNSCSSREEVSSDGERTISALFIPGSVVWAKQHGYPWWPAMVDNDPDITDYFYFDDPADQFPSQYHVAFLAEPVSRAWVCSSALKSFQRISPERLKKHVKKEMRRKLEHGIAMARDALSLDIPNRIRKYGFSERCGALKTRS